MKMPDPDNGISTTDNCFYSIFNDDTNDTVHIEIQPWLQWTAKDLFSLADHLYDKGIDLAGEQIFEEWFADQGIEDRDADRAELIFKLGKLLKAGKIAPNDARDILNLDPVEGGEAKIATTEIEEYIPRFLNNDTVIFEHRDKKYKGRILDISLDLHSGEEIYRIESGGYSFKKYGVFLSLA